MAASMTQRQKKEQQRWQPLESLVARVQQHPILYDMRHLEYRSSKKKDEVWEKIAAELRDEGGEGRCGQELKKLWQGSGGIRDRYSREKAKCKRTVKSGAGTTEVYESKWPLYGVCRFLDGCSGEPRKTTSGSIASSSDAEETSADDKASERAAASATTPIKRKRRPAAQLASSSRLTDEQLTEIVLKSAKEAEDESGLFGKIVAAKLRRMDSAESGRMQLQILQLLATKSCSEPSHQGQQSDCDSQLLSVDPITGAVLQHI